jgi:low temperature requirement protein LtrA
MGRLSLISALKARHPEEAHRVTTQLELFFDLISVIAISAATRIVFEAKASLGERDGLILDQRQRC